MREYCEGDLKAAGVLEATSLSAQSVRTQIEKILASELFCRSERLSRLLRFTVEETLSGRGSDLKESVLGAEVFDKTAPFDPQSDPIVRVETRRLRTKLEQYYQTEGKHDPVLIHLPKRTYVPQFVKRQSEAVYRMYSVMKSLSGWKTIVVAAAALVLFAPSIYRVAGSYSGRRAADNPSGRAAGRSLIVLPFADLSSEKDLEYFADGLTEETIAALAKVEGLHVISRTSSFQFKGKAEDVRKIGAQFNVDLVLEGSVRVSGEKLRVTGELVKVADGFQLWSSSYERGVEELPLPEEIARSIAETLRIRLAETSRRQAPEYPANAEAEDLYLKGLYDIGQGDEEAFVDAIEHFERAIQIAPNYALPYAGLADCYSMLAMRGVSAPSESMPKAQNAALKALELDKTLGPGHASLGVIKAAYNWDWAGAKREFDYALKLDPGDARIKEAYVNAYLLPMARLEDASKEIQRLQSLDSESGRIGSEAGLMLYFRRRYDESIAQYNKVLQSQPRFHVAQLAEAASLLQKSMFDDGLKALNKYGGAWEGGAQLALLGCTYARVGNREMALNLIEELKQASKRRYISACGVAEIYTALHDFDRAFEWLEKGIQQHSASLIYLKINPRFDALRPDARFDSLLKRVRLQE